MALQTLSIATSDTLPKTYSVSSVDTTDGLAITVVSDACGEVYVWGSGAITVAAGGGADVPLPATGTGHEVPARVWTRADNQLQRAATVTIKGSSSSRTVYVMAFPRATGV